MALQFADPVVNGATLVRQAIRSPGYVAGSAGWTINRDGSVEFNNGTFRGTLNVGVGSVGGVVISASGLSSTNYVPGVSGWHIDNAGSVEFNAGTFRGEVKIGSATGFVDISSALPAELTTFYSTHYTAVPVAASIRFVGVSNGQTLYAYQLYAVRALTQTKVVFATGIVDNSLTVWETQAVVSLGATPNVSFGAFTPAAVSLGSVAQAGALNLFSAAVAFFGAVNFDLTAGGSDWQVNGLSFGRGIPDVNANGSAMDILTTGSVVPTGGVETSVLAVPSMTYSNGRAYELTVFGAWQAFATSARPAFAIRQTSATGHLLADLGEMAVPVANRKYPMGATIRFVNRSGADVTDFVVLTLRDVAATGNNVQMVPPALGGVGFLGPPRDIGAAANLVNPAGSALMPTVS